jgi:hypothetical protein
MGDLRWPQAGRPDCELLKVSTYEELNRTIAEHEGELLYLVIADRRFRESLAQPGSISAFRPKIKVNGVTGELGVRLST